MSLTSKSKLISRINENKRQSFDKRICNDLSEVILQFLPFDDKFRLECVSKQFQRTIFQKLHEFEIKDEMKGLRQHWYEVYRHYRCEKVRPSAMFCIQWDLVINCEVESVLKKYSNFQYLDLKHFHFEGTDYAFEYNLLIYLIINYCNNLTQFECYYDLMNDKIKKKFIEKFGSKLKYLKFHEISDGSVYKSFPNIQEMDIFNVYFSMYDISDFQFKKLKKFRSEFDYKDISILYNFIDNNLLIEVLDIHLLTVDPIEINSVLNQISRLENLVKLKLTGDYGLNERHYKRSIRSMNCSKLMSIKCDITIKEDNYIKMSELLSSLKLFKHLKRLDIRITYEPYVELQNIQILWFNGLKGFENLTHLTIDSFDPYFYIDNLFLTFIGINLPKLKYLNIKPYFNSDELTHNILIALSSLDRIKMKISGNINRDKIQDKLKEHSKKFIIY